MPGPWPVPVPGPTQDPDPALPTAASPARERERLSIACDRCVFLYLYLKIYNFFAGLLQRFNNVLMNFICAACRRRSWLWSWLSALTDDRHRPAPTDQHLDIDISSAPLSLSSSVLGSSKRVSVYELHYIFKLSSTSHSEHAHFVIRRSSKLLILLMI